MNMLRPGAHCEPRPELPTETHPVWDCSGPCRPGARIARAIKQAKGNDIKQANGNDMRGRAVHIKTRLLLALVFSVPGAAAFHRFSATAHTYLLPGGSCAQANPGSMGLAAIMI